MFSDPISLHAIGMVRTEVADADIARRRRTLRSTIEIAPIYADALLGIEAYSHLIVLFWMHRRPATLPLVEHPRGDPALPLAGVLATRGRNHPNGIGLAVVELIARRGRVLEVCKLDAFDGTPVLDVKPYDDYDVVDRPRVPAWFKRRALTPPGDLG